MRTTLTLDDDLAQLLKRRAAQLGIPFKDMVNRALRTGLGHDTQPRNAEVPRTLPHSFGFRHGIDLDRLNQLADELEVEAASRALARTE